VPESPCRKAGPLLGNVHLVRYSGGGAGALAFAAKPAGGRVTRFLGLGPLDPGLDQIGERQPPIEADEICLVSGFGGIYVVRRQFFPGDDQ
jgi:hypothetical protein